jgi:hypothetical protein
MYLLGSFRVRTIAGCVALLVPPGLLPFGAILPFCYLLIVCDMLYFCFYFVTHVPLA